MQYIVIITLFACVACARLDHLQYLPPTDQQEAIQPDTSANALNEPFDGSSARFQVSPEHQHINQFQTPSGPEPTVNQQLTGDEVKVAANQLLNTEKASDQPSNNEGQFSIRPNHFPAEFQVQSVEDSPHQGPEIFENQPQTASQLSHELRVPETNTVGVTNEFAKSAERFTSTGSHQVPILRLESENLGDGTYRYVYQTGDGISAEEHGDAREGGTKAVGSFGYTSPDGQKIELSYVANEYGFQPRGSHLPTPPPIPEAILRALKYIEAEEMRRQKTAERLTDLEATERISYDGENGENSANGYREFPVEAGRSLSGVENQPALNFDVPRSTDKEASKHGQGDLQTIVGHEKKNKFSVQDSGYKY
ncbi:uncharacterized protein LOC132706946 [Cylas formicarius]|uniref:uncharacterized protein LOC132706946 n=1 Tax=Cylas formicarius TaxID=197179 RepID=UPI002958B28E|nr:uncharacterized protein LOC132706946 [Cylas formicarius]